MTPKRELRALALASEIMRLRNLNGYLRFPGPLPVARIRLDYVDRPKVADRFVSLKRQEGGEGKAVGSEPGSGLEPEPEHEIGSTREIPVDVGSEGNVTGEMDVDTEAERTVVGGMALDNEVGKNVTVELPVGDESDDEKPSTGGTVTDAEDERPPAGGKAPDSGVKGVVI